MKFPRWFFLAVAAVAYGQAAPVSVYDYEILTKKPQRFSVFVELSRYDKYLTANSNIPNLKITPRAAYEKVRKAWQNHYGVEDPTMSFASIGFHSVGNDRYLWCYAISGAGTTKTGESLQRTMLVLPNGDVAVARPVGQAKMR